MLRTKSLTGSSTILQLLVDMANKDEVGGSESSSNETNLSNLSMLKKSTKTGFLISKSAKRGGGNTKNGVKANRSSDYLIPNAKRAFNHLRHTIA